MSGSTRPSPPHGMQRPASKRSVQSQSNLQTALGRIKVPDRLLEGLPVMKVDSVSQLLARATYAAFIGVFPAQLPGQSICFVSSANNFRIL